jgi:hypothetical protein
MYGEHDKSSRKNIRRKKRGASRADRRRARQVLTGAEGPVAGSAADAAELQLLRRRPRLRSDRWRKGSDTSLGEYVENRLRRRLRLGVDDPVTARARIERVRKRREART